MFLPGRTTGTDHGDKALAPVCLGLLWGICVAASPGWCAPMHAIVIDGDFDDWTTVASYTDPVDDQHDTDHDGRYDTPVHVVHDDVDLLEYKFTHDDECLYAYFRSRGVIGRTQTASQGREGRYYVIVTIDVDNNDTTGYWIHEGGYYPTSSGYDMNMEVEFYGGAFNTGNYLNHGCLDEAEYDAAVDDQEQGIVDVRPGTYDWYTQWVWRDEPEGIDEEVILPNGAAIIFVRDKEDAYESIMHIALSADGHEAEMVAPFRGFMNYPGGEPIMAVGNVIDLSFSLEASGELAGDGEWGSDTAEPIVSYYLAPALTASPADMEVGAAAGSETLSFLIDPDTPVSWAATVTEGAGWFQITSGSAGTGSGTVGVTWSENEDCSPRTAALRIVLDESQSDYVDVTATQAGAGSVVLSVTPEIRQVNADGGTATFEVVCTGCGTLGWHATVTDGAEWFQIASGSVGAGSGTVGAGWSVNQGCDARTAVFLVTSDDVEAVYREVTVTQAGGEPVALSVTPEEQQVDADAGTAVIDVVCTGCGTLGWYASVNQGAQWFHVTSGSTGTASGTVAVAWDENQDCDARTAMLVVTADEAEDAYGEVTVTQAGGEPMTLSVTPATQRVSADGGAATFDVANTGCGTLNWQATTSEDWLAIQGAVSGNGDGTVTVVCELNGSEAPRTADLQVTASGAANSPAEVTVFQDGCAAPEWDGFVQASDGAYADRVQVSWSTVPGAQAYRVYRCEVDDPDSALPVSDWLIATLYDDYSAAAPLTSSSCPSFSDCVPYFYWVACRNTCGAESEFSPGDQGYRGAVERQSAWCTQIEIDGEFGDWAAVPSYSDPVDDQHDTDHEGRYDTPLRVDHDDVDLLEYKFTHDRENLYAYFRSRGVIGRTQTADLGRAGRYYIIASIDVDSNNTTGFWLHQGGYYPTSSGYDMNMEVEFYGGAFSSGQYVNYDCLNQAEYLEALEDQSQGIVEVGPGGYDWGTEWVWRDEPLGLSGEIVLPSGAAIDLDWQRGDIYGGVIHIAVSPDGHEAEMAAPFRGFMNHPSGEPIMALGNAIDVSLSLEASGELAGDKEWASDTAAPITGYYLSRPTLSVAPSTLDVSSAAGSENLAVEVGLDIGMAWNAVVFQDGEWLQITSGGSGTGSGTVQIAWDGNADCGLRTATVRVVAEESENGYAEMTVSQAGNPVPSLSVTPSSQQVGSDGGTVTFEVANAGCGTLNWQAASSESWFVIEGDASGAGDGEFCVTCDPNTEDTERTGTVHITAVAASHSPTDVTIVQESCPALEWNGLVSASNGGYTDRVRITWDSVPGAVEYRVYRSEQNQAEGALPLGGWQTGATYNDFTAAAPGSVMSCQPSTDYVSYFYWVKARNGCGNETDFSSPDEGYRGGTVPTNEKAAAVLPAGSPLARSLGDGALMVLGAALLLTRGQGQSRRRL